MIALYQEEEIGTIWPLFRAVMPSGSASEPGYAAFEETMVITRNKTMIDRAAPILFKGSAFIAIGALHLPGPDGLIELLRKGGYTVSAVN
ncbi:TraB/GumN family protein [Mesorhizobium delmotii]